MKKVLSLILMLVVVFTMGASTVMADAYVEELVATYESTGMGEQEVQALFAEMGLDLNLETMQITDASGAVLSEEEFNALMSGGAVTESAPTSTATPNEEDIKSQREVYLFEKNGDKVKVDIYLTGTDNLLNYVNEQAQVNGASYEDTTFDGNRAILVNTIDVTLDELVNQVGVGYYAKEGLFADTEYFFVPVGTLEGYGEEGQVLLTYAFKFGGRIEKIDIVVGQLNSFIVENTTVNWLPILILVIALIVIALVVVIIVLTLKSKKKVDKQKALKDEEFVSEDEIFEELIEEAGIEIEEVEEVEEVEDVEDVEEETAEDEENK